MTETTKIPEADKLDIHKLLSEATEKILKTNLESLKDFDKMAGSVITLAAVVSTFIGLCMSYASLVDPEVVKPLFGDAPMMIQFLNSLGISLTSGYLYVIGKNMERRQIDGLEIFDTQGF